MKLSHFRPAVQHYFGVLNSVLTSAVRAGDAAMASYLLEHHADKSDATELGLALVFAVDKAGAGNEAWLEIVRQIRMHPAAGGICRSIVGSGLNQSASNKNEAVVRELLCFAQTAQLTARDWDQVLFECLPQGDPEKRRIETRGFEDREGHAGILALVRQAMGRQQSSAPLPPQPQ